MSNHKKETFKTVIKKNQYTASKNINAQFIKTENFKYEKKKKI